MKYVYDPSLKSHLPISIPTLNIRILFSRTSALCSCCLRIVTIYDDIIKKFNWSLMFVHFILKLLWIYLYLSIDYMYHTLAARASGELCLKYIFAFGALARSPLVTRYV